MVITKSEQDIIDIQVQPPNAVSDHSVITWSVDFPHHPSISVQRDVRSWAKLDRDKFRTTVANSELYGSARMTGASELFEQYHRVLQKLADEFAPVRSVTVRRQRIAVWIDSECTQLRRLSRMLERRFKKTKLPSDKLAWVKQERLRHRAYREKEEPYWNQQLMEQSKQPHKLWSSMTKLLGKSTEKKPSQNHPTTDDLMRFFNDKVASVRQATEGFPVESSLPPSHAVFNKF